MLRASFIYLVMTLNIFISGEQFTHLEPYYCFDLNNNFPDISRTIELHLPSFQCMHVYYTLDEDRAHLLHGQFLFFTTCADGSPCVPSCETNTLDDLLQDCIPVTADDFTTYVNARCALCNNKTNALPWTTLIESNISSPMDAFPIADKATGREVLRHVSNDHWIYFALTVASIQLLDECRLRGSYGSPEYSFPAPSSRELSLVYIKDHGIEIGVPCKSSCMMDCGEPKVRRDGKNGWCFCDRRCIYFQDCCADLAVVCPDFIPNSWNNVARITDLFGATQCFSFSQRLNTSHVRRDAVLMIKTCRSGLDKCFDGSHFCNKHPLLTPKQREVYLELCVPVSSWFYGVSFANVRCAACNGITEGEMWPVVFAVRTRGAYYHKLSNENSEIKELFENKTSGTVRSGNIDTVGTVCKRVGINCDTRYLEAPVDTRLCGPESKIHRINTDSSLLAFYTMFSDYREVTNTIYKVPGNLSKAPSMRTFNMCLLALLALWGNWEFHYYIREDHINVNTARCMQNK